MLVAREINTDVYVQWAEEHRIKGKERKYNFLARTVCTLWEDFNQMNGRCDVVQCALLKIYPGPLLMVLSSRTMTPDTPLFPSSFPDPTMVYF